MLIESLRLEPNSAETANNLGVVYFHAGDTKKAGEFFVKSTIIDPNYAPAHNNAGVVFSLRKKYKKAAAAYAEAVRLRPGWALAVFNLGMTYVSLGQKPSALETQKILSRIDTDLARKLYLSIYSDKVIDVSPVLIG
jgi:protein O-GlcNAc transferase